MELPEQIDWNVYYRLPPTLSKLEGTPFYIGAVNLLYGLSKSGKSRSLAELLIKSKNTGKKIVWLDKDYNVDPETLKLFGSFTHANHDIDNLCMKLLNHESLDEYILVFDSLKDFSIGLDSNADAQKTMEYIRRFTVLGATVILIAHATETRDMNGKVMGFKLQGNSETIKSKCDCIIRFEKITSKPDNDKSISLIVRKFIPEDMRIATASTSPILLYDKEMLTTAIQTKIKQGEEMAHRELIKKFSSFMADAIKEMEGIAYRIEKKGKKKIVVALSPLP